MGCGSSHSLPRQPSPRDPPTTRQRITIQSVRDATPPSSVRKPSSYYQAIVSFLRERELNFDEKPDLKRCLLGFNADGERFLVVMQAIEKQDIILIYSLCPDNVPESRRKAVAEYFARVNYPLLVGNFEIDMRDGEMRYKTCVDCEGLDDYPNLIKKLFETNLGTYKQYIKGARKVMQGTSPQEAAQSVSRGQAELQAIARLLAAALTTSS
eukprot:gnl/Trimastix_PCT/1703.p1 GENE.gnl/Trimastix_PCT/1703~~gnl/Trimastix_PCT/1703.p1  ORF type:complete len:211 (+),score=35.90 gnl/Trimastix_PCT/1703:64-696(+)